MNQSTAPVSDEKLNAFLDKQLAAEERIHVFDAVNKDQELSKKLCELQRNDEMLSLAYRAVPQPPFNPYERLIKPTQRKYLTLAASILFALGLVLGWFLQRLPSAMVIPAINHLSSLDVTNPGNDKVLIHISSMDPDKINNALNKAEALLQNNHSDRLQLEVVANAQGLGLLRDNSPYAARIHQMASTNHNLSFKACGIAMQAAQLQEKQDIRLLPDAQRVPAALDEILDRLKSGWMYVKP